MYNDALQSGREHEFLALQGKVMKCDVIMYGSDTVLERNGRSCHAMYVCICCLMSCNVI